jgi:diguanylate cyclase (GGDEF)-like protein/PAS domain S-box-containing protein
MGLARGASTGRFRAQDFRSLGRKPGIFCFRPRRVTPERQLRVCVSNCCSAPIPQRMNARLIKEILLIEDNLADARVLREMFDRHNPRSFELTHVTRMRDAERHLSQKEMDLILLDLKLPDGHGLGPLRHAQAAAPGVPLVVLTGLEDESLAVQALDEGAQDYLVKGQLEPRRLHRTLRYAIERKRMADALFMEKERAEVAFNSISDAVVCTDVGTNVTYLNRVAHKMTGWSLHDATGHPLSEVLRLLSATNREVIADPLFPPLSHTAAPNLASHCIIVQRDGSEVPIEISVAPVHDGDGAATGAVLVFRDISDARAMALQIVHSAEHDLLTGLPNRLLLNDRISQSIALAGRDMAQIAVLFLDLDGFKYINDSLGHPLGDQLLQSVAQRLVKCVRGTDTVSRQGGDEFVILLTEVQQPEDAAVMANRMLQVVAQAHSVDSHDLHVTTSIGISVYPEDGQDPATLIKNADTAMYQAKENGRQSYQFFKPAMNVRAVERQSIEESLRRALERQEFALHYQPKINLATGAITGAEALLHWAHPTRGSLLPAQFIPIAEDCGLIVPIGSWVMRQACRQARVWEDAALPAASIAVNVSAMEFADENFLDRLFTILSETGADPESLQLELTESVVMKRPEVTAGILQILKQWGVRVAIDDFGTGYSSLSYLRKFTVHALKIDQSFVRQISNGGRDAAIVSAVIGMAHSLKLIVISEGVETLGELEFLRAHDCDEAQGYYFSRPLPPDQFATLLRRGMPRSLLRALDPRDPPPRSRADIADPVTTAR